MEYLSTSLSKQRNGKATLTIALRDADHAALRELVRILEVGSLCAGAKGDFSTDPGCALRVARALDQFASMGKTQEGLLSD